MATRKQKSIDALVEAFDSQMFRALAEPGRVEILKFLLAHGRSDIQTVAAAVGKDRSVISRHMHTLSDAGLLRSEKVSRNVFFEIDSESFVRKTRALFDQVSRAIDACCS
ncbi:MAG TPA: metalloregulator ArsR/SmtB family transcription factor [Thermoanaerobaculia bacterium]